MEFILNISGLSKRYGSVTAVQDLDLAISKGQIYGILGPNGSGKTTTLGMILGITVPGKGEFSWFDHMPLHLALNRIGSIIETPAFYPYLSGIQNLKIVTDIKRKGKEDIDMVLRKVGLLERKDHAYKGYSLGMKQRLALAAAMIGKPDVLVLDEPTNGMDPQGIADIRNLILEIAAGGATILLASHLLDEVQKTCTHVAVLDKGRKIFDGAVREILESEEYIEIAAEDMDALYGLLKSFKGIVDIQREAGKFIIQLSVGPTKKDLQKYLIQAGIFPTHFAARTGSLEKKFLQLLQTPK
ncbi:MAG: ATP-binding cassette domain-containing protein [Cyclobacteriaceae bacterium]|nr:ATP-binding cassette domain-containing protein [Cyclobacteriaceae bacterium]